MGLSVGVQAVDRGYTDDINSAVAYYLSWLKVRFLAANRQSTHSIPVQRCTELDNAVFLFNTNRQERDRTKQCHFDLNRL